MKNFLFHPLILILALFVSSLYAQNEEHPWQISFGFNAVDTFPTEAVGQGALFEDFLNVADHWNTVYYPAQVGITNYIGSGFSLGFNFSQNTISNYGDIPADNHLFVAADAVIKFDIGSLFQFKRFSPFIETGAGYVFFDVVSAGYFNSGFGIDYSLGEKKRTVLFVKTLFRNTGERYGQKHFQHSLGIAYRFGSVKDRDKDGIADKEDSCPDLAGKEELNGCPDTDGDGIQDAEDACPKSPGLLIYNGCPDTDNDGIEDSLDDCPEIPGKKEFNGCPDTDGDGIQDKDDACPEEEGSAEYNGCPDENLKTSPTKKV